MTDSATNDAARGAKLVAQSRRSLPKATDRIRLGEELEVSPFCLGHVVDSRVVPEAFDAGINFFFLTADMHWPYYEAARRGLADLLARKGGVRERIVVASVSYVTQPEFCHQPFKEVLEAVPRLDRLDVTIAGATARSDFQLRRREFLKHRAWGVRAYGATFHDRSFAAEIITSGQADIAYVRYNPMHRGAEQTLFPAIGSHPATPVYNFNSVLRFEERDYVALGISDDYWRPSATDYYRFALHRPELDGILCALATPTHVRELVDALAEGTLTDEELLYLRDLSDLRKGTARMTAVADT